MEKINYFDWIFEKKLKYQNYCNTFIQHDFTNKNISKKYNEYYSRTFQKNPKDQFETSLKQCSTST